MNIVKERRFRIQTYEDVKPKCLYYFEVEIANIKVSDLERRCNVRCGKTNVVTGLRLKRFSVNLIVIGSWCLTVSTQLVSMLMSC